MEDFIDNFAYQKKKKVTTYVFFYAWKAPQKELFYSKFLAHDFVPLCVGYIYYFFAFS